jgi:hypothetical protein
VFWLICFWSPWTTSYDESNDPLMTIWNHLQPIHLVSLILSVVIFVVKVVVDIFIFVDACVVVRI